MKKTELFGRGVFSIKLWILMGISFHLLSANDTGPQSPYGIVEWILYAILFFGLWANSKHDLRKKIKLNRKSAPWVYMILAWSFGMMYEVCLTVTGEGIGGVHQHTIPSFVIAQGDYIPIVVLSLLVIRHFKLNFYEAYFFAGGKSLTEGIVFNQVLITMLFSPFFLLTPVGTAYYALVYALIIALPLLFVDETLLWKDDGKEKKERSILIYWALGFFIALGIRIFWGLIYGPFVIDLFGFPAFSGS